jgi:small neutral amino acid transporter SnatA (MarC family)
MKNSLFPSVLRTVVPLLVGWVITVTGALGIEADSTAVAGGTTVLVTALYYLLFRAVEQAATRLQWEPLRVAAGLALGWARPPEYGKESTAGGEA